MRPQTQHSSSVEVAFWFVPLSLPRAKRRFCSGAFAGLAVDGSEDGDGLTGVGAALSTKLARDLGRFLFLLLPVLEVLPVLEGPKLDLLESEPEHAL